MENKCPACSSTLKEPYISCAECIPMVNICLKCFSKGKEFYQHINSHSYEVKRANFDLFKNSKWSANEELKLLDAMEELGFRNWKDISRKVRTKTAEECEQHYIEFYIDKPADVSLPKFEVNHKQCFRRPFPYKGTVHLPRPDGSNGEDPLFVVGYMPARGDFLIEYNNFAETDLKEVFFDDNEDDGLITELNLSVVEIYYSRLRERKIRKKIMKDYGLLLSGNQDIPYACGREERKLRENIRKFARFSKPDEHEKLIQSILYQKQIEARVSHLQEYRSHGLKYFKNAYLYEKLKSRRKKNQVKYTKLEEVLLHSENPLACQVWLQRQMSGRKGNASLPVMPLLNRRPANPLDLSEAPSVELLTENEKELCSSLRLLPEVYLNHRRILEKESFRSNGILLQDARTMLKIDVNKTKRLFDFIVSEGYIKVKESS